MVENGAGAVIASFTWLCAWESEYLGARIAQADDRVLVAEEALHSWGGMTPFPPPDFDNPAGVRADRPQVCTQAGIDNVTR